MHLAGELRAGWGQGPALTHPGSDGAQRQSSLGVNQTPWW